MTFNTKIVCTSVLLGLAIAAFPAWSANDPARKSGAESRFIDLKSLNKKHRNAIVRIEFTPVSNFVETRLNPSKSESYHGRSGGSHGTGFFINQNEILTNAHVVARARKGSLKIKSPATGNVEFKVALVGVSTTHEIDLAVLRLPDDEKMRFQKRSGLKKIPTLTLGDSASVKQSDPLAILGYPLSSDELKVIEAEVTGRHYPGNGRYRAKHQFIEVGPGGVIQPGNSGGPALNQKGIVVGIPTLANYRGSSGWLTPTNIVKAFLDRIRKNEQGKIPIDLPELGLTLTRNFPGTSVLSGAPAYATVFGLGVVVEEVIPDSLGEQWGFRKGDIILGFRNKQKKVSCALDFEGYKVVTGKMARWPEGSVKHSNEDKHKIHLEEMIFMSDDGDDVTLWYVRPLSDRQREPSPVHVIQRKVEVKRKEALRHLALYEKPDFELWGDFVVQDFNDFSVHYFDVPKEEWQQGGVLVTYVEANSLASDRGISPGRGSRWIIVDEINGAPVVNLEEFRKSLTAAETLFEASKQSIDYQPEKRILLEERYMEIGIRAPGQRGETDRYSRAFPIDEAKECSQSPASGTPASHAPAILAEVKVSTGADVPQ